MTTITIPKNVLPKTVDLIAIPRKEYEEFLRLRLERMREVELTPAQKKGIALARKNIANGNYFTLDELKQKLGFSH